MTQRSLKFNLLCGSEIRERAHLLLKLGLQPETKRPDLLLELGPLAPDLRRVGFSAPLLLQGTLSEQVLVLVPEF